MATSQNGWPIVDKSDCDQGPFAGVTFPNGILKGDVATIARWQLKRYEALVEPCVAGTCWGWYVKVIEGTTTKSNHGSATAWDINATQHPMGVPASKTMSQHKIAMCRRIVDESHGVLRWGGDYTVRPDPMHWEIDCIEAEAAAFAREIRASERTVAMAEISGYLPLQQKGDQDQPGKTQWIKRAQAELKHGVGADLRIDGDYGDQTAAALKELMADDSARTTTNGSKIGIPEWRRLYGIW
jgi:hypothetical protein